jgi:cytochrome P450
MSGLAPQEIACLEGFWALRCAAALVSDPIQAMQQVYARHGPLTELWPALHSIFSKRTFLFAIGPDYNKAVLGNPAVFRSSGLMLRGPPGSAQRRVRLGLVSMNGVQHAHYRKLLSPAFRRSRVDSLAEAMPAIVDEELNAWPIGSKVDLWPLCRRVAQHVAVALLFQGAECAAREDARESANVINRHITMAGSAAVRGCPINLPHLPYNRFLTNARRTEDHLVKWAKQRQHSISPDDLISLILHAPDETGERVADKTIAGHIFTLFGASYETCQSALTWTLFLLAQHPQVNAALLDEVSSLSLEGADVAEQVERCTWLDAVVKEAMRILPPVPMQIREVVEDTVLQGHEIRKHTRVILSPFITNRLAELYPEGDRFIPQRWLSLSPDQFEYLVFSAGPRTCLGYRFATNFLKIALAQIVRRFRISIVDRAEIDYRVTIAMIPRRGVPVTLHPQDRKFAASRIRGNILNLLRLDRDPSVSSVLN